MIKPSGTVWTSTCRKKNLKTRLPISKATYFADDKPVGLLRYNLFWDNTPFCTLLFIDWQEQHKGYGKQLLKHWEEDMKAQGYGMVLTSTQVDETAQHFYRKNGYKDCGSLVMNIPGYEQPMEMFLSKGL